MGIKNLWQLLSPVGRSVSIETLSGKTLAVDVSIWLTQFIKAMRDDDGKVMKNAHIIGTLRRVVKLLFHRIRPVFVFDGGAPALKARTLAARRRIRSEGTDSSMRKTAQRILASQLKKHKVAMSAAKRGTGQEATAVFNPVYQTSSGDTESDAGAAAAAAAATATAAGGVDSRKTSAAASVAAGAADAAVNGGTGETASSSPGGGDSNVGVKSQAAAMGGGGAVAIRPRASVSDVGGEDSEENENGDGEDDEDDDVDWEELEVGDGGGVLGASRQALVDSDGDEVGEAVVTPGTRRGAAGVASLGGGSGQRGGDGGDESAGWAVDTDEDEEEGSAEWEEVELPERNEDIDPEVIASLPDRVKKQVIETAKRRQRMRSRAQYMPVAGDPVMYSQTQISNFLRSQKLNSQIMRVHKQDDGDNEGKRIASEANRRYILTHGVTGSSSGGGGVVSKVSSAATSSTGAAKGANDRRRWRISEGGEDFKEWSYSRPSLPSPPRSNASETLPAGAGRDSEESVNDRAAHDRSPDRESGGTDGHRRTSRSEVDEVARGEEGEEEAGGFLPESEEEAGGFLAESETEAGGFLAESEGEAGGFLPESEEEAGGFLPESEAEAKGGSPEHEEEAGGFLPESDEEAGGFLPESDGKDGSSTVAGMTNRKGGDGGGASGVEERLGGGFQRDSPSGGGSGGDSEGFDLPPKLNSVVASSRSGTIVAGARKGEGKAGLRSPSPLTKRSVAGKGAGGSVHIDRTRKGKGRLQLAAGTVVFEGEEEEEEEEDEEEEREEGGGGGSHRSAACVPVKGLGSEAEAADDAIARKLQEEEDRRAALALQADLHSAADVAFFGVDGSRREKDASAKAGAGLDPPRLPGSEKKSAEEAPKPTSVHSISPAPPLVSGGGDARGVADSPTAEGGCAEGGDTIEEVELEIDLKDLEAAGGRSALMSLLSSANADVGSGVAVERAGGEEEDSDENFDGFVDDEQGSVGGDERPHEAPGASVANNAALQRSVDMASRMAGWAGRVVERVLKEHRKPVPGSSGSSSVHAHNRAQVSSSNGRTNESQTAPIGGTPPTPITTGPAAAGAGSHAAAQAASEERRRLEGNGKGRPTASESRRTLFVEDQESGENIGGGPGAAVAAVVAASSKYDNSEETSPPCVKPSDSITSTSDALLAPHGKVATVSSAAEAVEASERNRVRETGAGQAGPLTNEESEDLREAAESSVGGEGTSTAEGGGKAAVMPNMAAVDGTTVRSASSSNGVVDAKEVESKRVSPSVKTSASGGTKPSTEGKGTTERPESGAGPSFVPPRPRSQRETGDQTALVDGSPETRTEVGVSALSGPNHGAEIDGQNAAATGVALASTGERSGELKQEGGVDTEGGTPALFQPSLPGDADSGLRQSWSARPAGTKHGVQETTAIGGELGGGNDEPGGFAEPSLGVAYLGDMDEEELEEESEKLKRESNRAQRDAETVTDEMKEEVMDLLKLFGVPYVVAPMEAEAQCCELERLRLVDGTVTDDSDAFAFGGRAVYKNIFNEKKFVEAYLLPDAEKDIGVGTDEVIALALLLGSDYTEGVRGVGIVNAMEIINAFPLEGKGAHHGLSKFKTWVDGFDPVLDRKLESLLKNGSKSEIDELSLETKFHLKHRTARNRWSVSENFPSKEVIDAYKKPRVDKSEEPFSWAEPDIHGLRALCQRVLGWNQFQSDGLLMPMIKELERGGFSQPRIDRFFMTYHDNKRVAAIKSKRLRTAVEDLAHGSTEVLTVKGSAARAATITKRKKTAGKAPSSADMEKARRKAAQGSVGGGKRQRNAALGSRVPRGDDANEPRKPSGDSQSARKRRRNTVTDLASSDDRDPLDSAEAALTSSGDSDVSPSSLAANPSHEDGSVSIDGGGPRAKRTRSTKTGAKDNKSVAGRSTRSRAASGKAGDSAAAAADTAVPSGSRSSRRVSAGSAASTAALTGDGNVAGASNNRRTCQQKGSEAPVPPERKRRYPRREVAQAVSTASSGFGGGKGPLVGSAGGEELGGSGGSDEGGGGVDEDDDDDYCGSNSSDSED